MCNSTEFPKNLSIVDSVSRAITFTYLGKTATTTITQAALEPIYFEDPEAGIVLKAKGLIANASYSDEGELGLITSLNSTFYNNKILTKFPELRYCINVTNMTNTFSSCSSLTQAPIIPANVTDMYGAFAHCSNLTEAPIIPASVTSMSSTFQGCTSLTEAPTIPASVTNMSSTFYNCTKLTQAPIIPANVTSMSETFRSCSNINGIYIINPTTPPTYSYSLTNVVEIYVPDASVEVYKAASGWIAHAAKIKPISTKP